MTDSKTRQREKIDYESNLLIMENFNLDDKEFYEKEISS